MKKILMACACSMMLFACNKKDCDPGFSGPNCDVQDVPGSVTINSVDLSGFPDTKADGSAWDTDGSPDIYFVLLQNGSEIYTSDTKTDVSSGMTVTYTDGMPFNVSGLDDDFTIEWRDDDSALGIGFNDLMGTFGIDLTTADNNGSIILVNPAGSEFSFTIHVENNF